MTDQRTRSLILSHFLPYRVVNLARQVSDQCSDIYRQQFDVSVPEWRILATLAEGDNQNSRHIGEVTFMDKSKVSRAVKLLESKGYLVKTRDSSDNRINYLSLTDSGRGLYHQIAPHALEWEAELISALEISEYRDLMRIMEKLEKKLQAML